MAKRPSLNPATQRLPVVQMISGVKYILTSFDVVDRFSDGQPKTLRVVRPNGGPDDSDGELAYAPASWSRGPQ